MPARNHADREDDHGKNDRHHEYLEVMLALSSLFRASLLIDQRRIFGNELRRKGQIVENLQHVIYARLSRIERHTPGVVRKIDRDIDNAWQCMIMLLDICDAIRTMHTIYRYSYRLLHTIPLYQSFLLIAYIRIVSTK